MFARPARRLAPVLIASLTLSSLPPSSAFALRPQLVTESAGLEEFTRALGQDVAAPASAVSTEYRINFNERYRVPKSLPLPAAEKTNLRSVPAAREAENLQRVSGRVPAEAGESFLVVVEKKQQEGKPPERRGYLLQIGGDQTVTLFKPSFFHFDDPDDPVTGGAKPNGESPLGVVHMEEGTKPIRPPARGGVSELIELTAEDQGIFLAWDPLSKEVTVEFSVHPDRPFQLLFLGLVPTAPSLMSPPPSWVSPGERASSPRDNLRILLMLGSDSLDGGLLDPAMSRAFSAFLERPTGQLKASNDLEAALGWVKEGTARGGGNRPSKLLVFTDLRGAQLAGAVKEAGSLNRVVFLLPNVGEREAAKLTRELRKKGLADGWITAPLTLENFKEAVRKYGRKPRSAAGLEEQKPVHYRKAAETLGGLISEHRHNLKSVLFVVDPERPVSYEGKDIAERPRQRELSLRQVGEVSPLGQVRIQVQGDLEGRTVLVVEPVVGPYTVRKAEEILRRLAGSWPWSVENPLRMQVGPFEGEKRSRSFKLLPGWDRDPTGPAVRELMSRAGSPDGLVVLRSKYGEIRVESWPPGRAPAPAGPAVEPDVLPPAPPQDLREVAERLARHEVRWLEVRFTDPEGRLDGQRKGVLMPVGEGTIRLLQGGIGFDGSSVRSSIDGNPLRDISASDYSSRVVPGSLVIYREPRDGEFVARIDAEIAPPDEAGPGSASAPAPGRRLETPGRLPFVNPLVSRGEAENKAVRLVRDHFKLERVHLLLSDWEEDPTVVPLASEGMEQAFRAGVPLSGAQAGRLPFAGEKAGLSAVPDPYSLRFIPEADGSFQAVLFVTLIGPDGKAFPGDPREWLRKSQERIEEGMGVAVSMAPEPEFYLFRKGKEGALEPAEAGLYYDEPGRWPADVRGTILECIRTARSAGIEVRYAHHEVGPGQFEMPYQHASPLEAADQTVLYKYILKKAAGRHGLEASFLPKPIPGKAGSGMHIHQSLTARRDMNLSGKPYRPGDNIFFDPQGDFRLSDTAWYYMGGLLMLARGMLRLTNPDPNSYLRIVPGFEAPTNLVVSDVNRSAGIRIPSFGDAAGARFEARWPDPYGNIHAKFAALLWAGWMGIERGWDPREWEPSPVVSGVNVYRLAPDERLALGIRELPGGEDGLAQAVLLFDDPETAARTEALFGPAGSPVRQFLAQPAGLSSAPAAGLEEKQQPAAPNLYVLAREEQVRAAIPKIAAAEWGGANVVVLNDPAQLKISGLLPGRDSVLVYSRGFKSADVLRVISEINPETPGWAPYVPIAVVYGDGGMSKALKELSHRGQVKAYSTLRSGVQNVRGSKTTGAQMLKEIRQLERTAMVRALRDATVALQVVPAPPSAGLEERLRDNLESPTRLIGFLLRWAGLSSSPAAPQPIAGASISQAPQPLSNWAGLPAEVQTGDLEVRMFNLSGTRELPPEIPLHRLGYESCYVVLQGNPMAQIGEQAGGAGDDSFLRVPAGAVHGFRATRPARLLSIRRRGDTPLLQPAEQWRGPGGLDKRWLAAAPRSGSVFPGSEWDLILRKLDKDETADLQLSEGVLLLLTGEATVNHSNGEEAALARHRAMALPADEKVQVKAGAAGPATLLTISARPTAPAAGLEESAAPGLRTLYVVTQDDEVQTVLRRIAGQWRAGMKVIPVADFSRLPVGGLSPQQDAVLLYMKDYGMDEMPRFVSTINPEGRRPLIPVAVVNHGRTAGQWTLLLSELSDSGRIAAHVPSSRIMKRQEKRKYLLVGKTMIRELLNTLDRAALAAARVTAEPAAGLEERQKPYPVEIRYRLQERELRQIRDIEAKTAAPLVDSGVSPWDLWRFEEGSSRRGEELLIARDNADPNAENKTAIGFLVVTERDRVERDRLQEIEFEIQHLAVLPGYQRLGVASQLVSHLARNRVSNRGRRYQVPVRMVAKVRASDVGGGRSFFAEIGWDEGEVIPGYFKDTAENAVVFEKVVPFRGAGSSPAPAAGLEESGRILAVGPRFVAVQSPDRRWLYLRRGTADGLISAALGGRNGQVTAAHFSANGSWLTTAESDGEVDLWDPATGELTASFAPVGEPISSIAFSESNSPLELADPEQIIAVTASGKEYRWSVSTRRLAQVNEPACGHVVDAGVGVLRSSMTMIKTPYLVVGDGLKQTEALLEAQVPADQIVALVANAEEKQLLVQQGIWEENVFLAEGFTDWQEALNHVWSVAAEWVKTVHGVEVTALRTTDRSVQGLLTQLLNLFPATWRYVQPPDAEQARKILLIYQIGV